MQAFLDDDERQDEGVKSAAEAEEDEEEVMVAEPEEGGNNSNNSSDRDPTWKKESADNLNADYYQPCCNCCYRRRRDGMGRVRRQCCCYHNRFYAPIQALHNFIGVESGFGRRADDSSFREEVEMLREMNDNVWLTEGGKQHSAIYQPGKARSQSHIIARDWKRTILPQSCREFGKRLWAALSAQLTWFVLFAIVFFWFLPPNDWGIDEVVRMSLPR